jgi:predicted phage-related endonuclease
MDISKECEALIANYVKFFMNKEKPSKEDVDELLQLEQGGEKWKKKRTGITTSTKITRMADLNPYERGRAYFELLTGQREPRPVTSFTQYIMDRGTVREESICKLYSRITGYQLETCGIGLHKEHPWIGSSPDRLIVGEKGGFEAKHPYFKQHTFIPEHYMAQLQVNLEVFERDWWDIGFYYEPKHDPSSFIVTRVYRCPQYWKVLFARVTDFMNALYLRKLGYRPPRAMIPTPHTERLLNQKGVKADPPPDTTKPEDKRVQNSSRLHIEEDLRD